MAQEAIAPEVAYTATTKALVLTVLALYLCWTFVPDPLLRSLGITYYPDKQLTAALPLLLCATVVAAFWVYEGVNMASVPHLESPRTIADSNSKAPVDIGSVSTYCCRRESVPPVMDMPAVEASRVLHASQAADRESVVQHLNSTRLNGPEEC